MEAQLNPAWLNVPNAPAETRYLRLQIPLQYSGEGRSAH